MIFKNLFIIILFSAVVVFAQSERIKADKNKSTISYKLTHPLHEIEAESNKADCYLDIDTTSKVIKDVAVQVNVTSFNSGNSNRDSHAMEVVDALDYPNARFISTNVTQKGDSVFAKGNLTFHGIKKEVTIHAITNWSSGQLTLKGGFDISLTEFHIKRPSLSIDSGK